MSSSPDKSLKRQLLAWLLGPLLLVLAVNAFLSYRAALTTANEANDRLLLASVKAIADRVTVAHDEISVDIPYVALDLFESNIKERIFYKVTAPDGAPLTGYEDLPPPPVAVPHDQPLFFQSSYHGENLYQAALYKHIYGPSVRGPVLIQVAETSESREALSRRILYDGLVRQGFLIAFAALLLWFGVRHALRPLMRLRDSIAGRAAIDITPVEESGVQSEVRPLIQALNQHTDRIDKMMASRVRFVADAAHQLRTRLTILRTRMEYAARYEEPRALHDAFTEAHALIDQTSHLVNQLLVLAHAEAKVVPGRDVEIADLAAVVHAITLDWVPQARAKDIALAFEGPDRGQLARGNALLLRELFSNLLDNAIRYTQRGGAVTARVLPEGDWIEIEIEDNGPGIPAAERERVFERFYRVPDSNDDGSGLGLAIAREICRSHAATIEIVDPDVGSGVIVRVRMPRVAAQPVATAPERSPVASVS
jgi:two-component system sensor histidine kinase TctE